MGYTIFVQSPLSQPIVHINENMYRKFLDCPKGMPIENYAGEEGLTNIKLTEGQLIESFKTSIGELPAWNKIGGSLEGQKFATNNNYAQIVEWFSKMETNNYLVSRSSIRELAENPTYEWFEVQLHGLRMMMLSMGMTYDETIKFQKKYNTYFGEIWDRMEQEGYFLKQLEM